MTMYKAWKAQSASLKKKQNASLLPVEKQGSTSKTSKDPKKASVVKRSSVHGYSKVQPRSRKKAGLKFMGQG